MRKYGLKLTNQGGVSDYDSKFIYPTSGEVICPDADYNSKDPCGRGIHIALSLSGGLNYMGSPEEIRLVKLTGKLLGKDKDKARYDKCEVLCVLTTSLDKDYWAKIDPLDEDYQAKRAQLDEAFMRKAIRYYREVLE